MQTGKERRARKQNRNRFAKQVRQNFGLGACPKNQKSCFINYIQLAEIEVLSVRNLFSSYSHADWPKNC